MTAAWPELTLSTWADSRDTFHLWTQIVGKVRLAYEPMSNHWWQVTLYPSARGLTTSVMRTPTTDLELEFDLLDHVLDVRTSDGARARVTLEPRSVADFYDATLGALHDVGVDAQIMDHPVEIAGAIPFPDDTEHHAYDGDAIQRYWRALLRATAVMKQFRSGFLGKVSPVHFFWGSNDLALTRFSGRTAPKHPGGVPNCPDWVQELAYSHELSSCGYWPGGSDEGVFYAYAYPQPDGFAEWPVAPDAASFDKDLGEFVLPYTAVRTAGDPEATLLSFFETTYDAAADLAHWDRAALEVAR